jgi:hypothetical protein
LKYGLDEWFGCWDALALEYRTVVWDFGYLEESLVESEWLDLLPFRFRLSLSQRLIDRLKLKCDFDEWFGCCEALAAMCLTIVQDFDDFANSIVECEWFDLLRFWLRLSLSLSQRVILRSKLKCDCKPRSRCWKAMTTKNLTSIFHFADFARGVQETVNDLIYCHLDFNWAKAWDWDWD